jgi:hypothetical protein
MSQFSEFLQYIESNFRKSGFLDVDIAPPENIDIATPYLDMCLEMHVHQTTGYVDGTPRGCLTLSGSKDTFRRLGLLLVGFAVITSRQDFEKKRTGDLDISRSVMCVNLSGEGADKLMIGSYRGSLDFFNFVPTSLRYFYARSDAAADSREQAAVGRYDRPYFGFYVEEKQLKGDWLETLHFKKGAVTMGNTVSALLRLGGFLLDFSHPDNDVEVLELEQAFEQVASMSYDMHFVLAGSVNEYLVFGYHTAEPSEQARRLAGTKAS